MDSIEVTAHFNEQGIITPLHFIWKGSTYRVESTGRRWLDEDGLHMLVMVSSGRIYDLSFKGSEGRWYIGQVGPNRAVV